MWKPSSLNKKHLTRYLIVVAVISAACLTLPRYFCFALPPSLFHYLFWVDKDTRVISRGDYVLYIHSDKRTGDKPLHMVKKVVCSEGDLLTVDSSKRYFCNGGYVGKAKDRALNGSPLTNFVWNGPIPPGLILAMGEHKDSYDCRYYGFVKKTSVINKAHPVFN